MSEIVVAAAQSSSIAGDIPRNVANHIRFAAAAETRGVRLLVFPELSLTGYELGLARFLAIRPDAAVLEPLRTQAVRSNMTIVAGAPLPSQTGDALHIAAFVYGPDGSTSIHTKQHVHSSEAHVFQSGAGGTLLRIDDVLVALAICYDAANPSHAEDAASRGASLYAVGAMIDGAGYPRKSAFCQSYAKQHRMAVLLANYSGETGGEISEGRSAIWSVNGELAAATPGREECLVIASGNSASVWTRGETVAVA